MTIAAIMLVTAFGASPFLETQRLRDQALESPEHTLISADRDFFYVFGQFDMVVHQLAPAGRPSPREDQLYDLPGIPSLGRIRDVALSPDGESLYILRSGDLIALEVNALDGAPQNASIITPPPHPRNERRFLSGIVVSSDNRFVYLFGADLLVYERTQDGLLLVQQVDYKESDTPFSVSPVLSPNGEEILAAVRSGAMRLIQLDTNTGSAATASDALEVEGGAGLGVQTTTFLDENAFILNFASALQVWRRPSASEPFDLLHVLGTSALSLPPTQFSAIALSPAGDDLYAFDENSPSVARFMVMQDQTLILAETFDVAADMRDIRFLGEDRLLAALRGDDAFVVVDRDPDTGQLTLDVPQQRYDGEGIGTQGLADARFDLNPAGTELYSTSSDDRRANVFAVDPETGRLGLRQGLTLTGSFSADVIAGFDERAFYSLDIVALSAFTRPEPLPGQDPGDFALAFQGFAAERPTVGVRDASRNRLVLASRDPADSTVVVGLVELATDGVPGASTFIKLATDSPFGVFPSSLDVSADGRFVYLALTNQASLYVLEVDPVTGELTLLQDFNEPSLATTSKVARALPDGRVALIDGGLYILRHRQDGLLEPQQRFDRALAGEQAFLGDFILALTNPDRIVAYGQEKSFLFQAGVEGVFALVGEIEGPAWENVFSAAATANGRQVYLSSMEQGALWYVRTESLLDDGFEEREEGIVINR